MSDLRAVFPEVDDSVDGIVAENGAVLVARAGIRGWPTPLPLP
jgi:hypothetical protein